jgi:ribosome-binding factor A
MARGGAHSPRRFPRTARVNEVVHEVIAEALERLSDPRVELVTVTGVDVSADLRHATIYYSVPVRRGATAAKDEVAAGLTAAAPHLRTELGRQVRMKYLPRLAFREDPSVEAAQRVEDILREIHDREDDRAGAPGSDAGPGVADA